MVTETWEQLNGDLQFFLSKIVFLETVAQGLNLYKASLRNLVLTQSPHKTNEDVKVR